MAVAVAPLAIWIYPASETPSDSGNDEDDWKWLDWD